MKEFRKYILPILSVLFFLMASLQENLILHQQPEKKLIQTFEHTLHKQELNLAGYLNVIEKKLSDSLTVVDYTATFSYLNPLFEEEGFGFIIFRDQKMVYWSDNHFSFPFVNARFNNRNMLLVLPNGIYEAQKRSIGTQQVIGLIHIKNNYSYENQFLENSYIPPFKLPAGFNIITAVNPKAYEIRDLTNQPLFWVMPSGKMMFNESQLYLPVMLYLLGFILLLLSIYRMFIDHSRDYFTTKMLVLAVILVLIYWVHTYFGIPTILNFTNLFSAKYYAGFRWLPSFGDYLLIATLFFFWSLVFVRRFMLHHKFQKSSFILSFIFAGLLYQVVGLMIGNLIENSNITYKLYRITDINQYSIGSYLAIALLLFSVFLINHKVVEKGEGLIKNSTFLKFNLFAVSVSIGMSLLFQTTGFYLLTLFFAVNLVQIQLKKLRITSFSLSYAILFISLFSIASLVVIYQTVKQHELRIQRLMAVNLSSEQDPIAEVLLSNVQKQLDVDSLIQPQLVPPYKDLESYLTRTYFGGYFRKYDIRYYFCTQTDSILIQLENTFQPCFPFFEKMISRSGTKISGSDFYFMNNMNGRVSYLSKIHYPLPGNSNGISIFIELNSKTWSEGIGFPELLMDRSIIKPFRYKYLSSAKYFDDELVNRSGDYTYNNNLKSYNLPNPNAEFELRVWDGYNHVIYRVDKRNYIIVSNPQLRFVDYLISFPYIFVFYFLFVLIASLIGNPLLRKMIIPHDLRFRIQAAIISVVLISLLFVAAGTIYYNIQDYENRHQSDLHDKIKSISEEIENRLISVNSITPDLQQWLFTELYNLSNVFTTDINIYDINGGLIASSRPEIFRKAITSEKMNAVAFYQLSVRSQLNFLQPEKIGKLSYLSVYEPIENDRGDYLGYLNLPYFTREDELKQGISTFIVAFINLYLFLFLTSVIMAIFLSNKITLPLSLIRKKLKSIQLGKRNEPINYDAEDEIGALVKEYNHKVEELAESAELLARSERESAWREMAKQVAHEIKNPLTPMKLNIQYLQRAKEEGNEHYDDFFDRVTRNLIEQIDTLSGIATEFSNFAQIPKAKNEVFNLIEVLRSVVLLFEPNENLHFSLETEKISEVVIFADKEQLSRAFLNLVKNGIQAIPTSQKGEISITVHKIQSNALITICDNGTGISKDAEDHLFEPNFTTKTSGMGLGLSIVRNIITNFNGKIWHETSETEGTKFYVEIPLYQPALPTENKN